MDCETLGIELQSLQSVLIMVEFALQRYGSTPLGEPLVHFIRPEVAQCHLSLKAFADKVIACQQSLSLTTIRSLWKKVIWAASDEAASLSAKLSNHRLKLVTLLITLNSVGWMDSGVSCLNPGQAFTGHNPPISIKDKTIDVVDPLGEILPIPTLFCGTWEAFDHVLKGFSRNRVGQHYVDQGDYQIVHPNNDKTVNRSDLYKLKEGETVEMSIILRSGDNNENRNRCPRCSFLDDHAPLNGGWTKCLRCSGRFRVKNVLNDERGLAKTSDGCTSNSNDLSTGVFKTDETEQTPNVWVQDPISDIKYFRRICLEILLSHASVEPGSQKEICSSFIKGNCKFGYKCMFAHVLPGQIMEMDRKNKAPAQMTERPSRGSGDEFVGYGEPQLSSRTGIFDTPHPRTTESSQPPLSPPSSIKTFSHTTASAPISQLPSLFRSLNDVFPGTQGGWPLQDDETTAEALRRLDGLPGIAQTKSPISSSGQASGSSPLSKATGIRMRPTASLSLNDDMPTQPRKYTAPSATPKKELPAVFARRRLWPGLNEANNASS
ncbi:hypothetical protein GALMADRAFT_252652 [Galerina marginata CBS 339.88]|uniref:C3H1-type domain-containing protein n=1 Tax=Galerina marginata (strain CBS 339.88) TaxID=685588 RepID=A0A067T0J4_GALM3|nr:hypothetical protein GALMADRAFT_252652 [Galerina marginata CBS 339.88]